MTTIDLDDRELAIINSLRMPPESWNAIVEQQQEAAITLMTPDARAAYDAYMALPLDMRTALDLAHSLEIILDQFIALASQGVELSAVFAMLTADEQAKITQLAAILPRGA